MENVKLDKYKEKEIVMKKIALLDDKVKTNIVAIIKDITINDKIDRIEDILYQRRLQINDLIHKFIIKIHL
ncbi:MAG: hypothetical protein LBD41_04070 [Clostridiales Family XIII bacterium]|nr:hypothetical protein [Clostridiales Family XIII bacterium]